KKEMVYRAIPDNPDLVLFDRQQLTDRFIAGVKADFGLLVKLSMLFVTVLLLISFGRIEIALLAAMPMYASWLITLGFMGFTGIRFNIFNIIISSFIFGLGVDYSILMTRGLLNRYKYGITDISNYKISIFLSSFTTIIGVAVLFFARHPALNSIALIAVVGVLSVVMITFTLQPMVFGWMIGRRQNLKNFPVTMRIFFKTIITWGNIVLIAMIMAFSGMIIFVFFPLSKKKKQYLFHYLFSKLSKAYIAVTFPTNRKLINLHDENFAKPAIIISNHQSLIETPAFLRLYPKILILTNEWVWNSPLFGAIARMASFFNAEHGIDAILDKLQEKVNEGYSILIFPEAHRSNDGHIQRFHRGAFYLAERLHLDLLPVVVFGSGDFLGRNAFWGRPNGLNMKILKRITPEDLTFGATYSERAHGIRKLYQKEYSQFKAEEGTGFYFRKKLILNYVFKGPVLEWYMRVKMKLAGNYEIFNKLIPRKGNILDIGCGYGFISYMLMLTSDDRRITAVDYDEEKIAVATNGYLKNDRISFVCSDITQFPITKHHAFLLSDVLHYLDPGQQEKLLLDCIENLEENGVILIRDADAGQIKNHRSSRLTEFLSTKVIGFNKTGDAGKTLSFTSVERIIQIAAGAGCKTTVVEESRHTSNTLLVITK
ncbi:MAG TPA: 1-acyl-sn-glycerol-3-phosphate acyltransferase, partial [Bacteroidales bacterium]|nr:1-acyl-sn-glycerol-3-phosphate acyltransferase [Bacteroidales bacterium]